MSRLAKVLSITLGVLIGLPALAVAGLTALSSQKLNKTYDIPEIHFKAAAPTPELIDRGQRLSIMHACAHCHGHDMGGAVIDKGFLLGTWSGPNLTNDPSGLGTKLTDEDWVRAVRHSVDRDHHPLLLMPGEHYYDDMPDEDMSALIAYTRSLPPVNNGVPAFRNGPYAHFLFAIGAFPIYADRIKHDSVTAFVPDSGVTVRNGARLARMCFACHAKDLGGLPPGLGVPPGPNLTRGGNLKDWSEEQFLHFIRTGTRPNGLRADPKVMPYAAFAMLNDDELKSLWAYIHSVPVVDRSVHAPAQPAQQPAKPAGAQPSST